MPRASCKFLAARGVLATAGGVAVALAFPPHNLTLLLPGGIAALMIAVSGTRGWAGFVLGLVFGLGFLLPLMRWITVIGADAWLALCALEALFYALMGMSWSWLRPRPWWPVATALTWAAAETLRGLVPFGGLPWGWLAFGLAGTSVDRWGRVGGTSWVAFLVVLATGLVVAAYERRRRPLLAGGLALVALAVPAAALFLPVGVAGAAGSVTVAAVQGNVPGQGLDAFSQERAVLDNHVAATQTLARQVDRGARPRPDFVIWPENSSDIDPFADPSAYREIMGAVRAVGVPTLVGAVVSGPDADHVQNMGIVWDPRAGPGQEYVKRHPVPFGEYIPFRGVLTRYITRLDAIPRDFAPGQRVGTLDLAGTRIGDVICFEVAYDNLIRDVVDHGATMLVVQTNNATYTGTDQLAQQFAISRYRAVETGRTVVVAATSGISGIIAPDGRVVDESRQRTRAILEHRVTLGTGVTWGVRCGPVISAVLAVAGASCLLLGFLGRRRTFDKMGQ